MRIFVYIFLFSILSQTLFADKGIVMVHEAPLFKEADYESRVVQYVRQGKLIYIHKRHTDDLKINSSIEENSYGGVQKNKLILNNHFYETMDNNAGRAYIPAQFVKLITNDDHEVKQPMANYSVDPTDYRHPDPLPKNYPLYNPMRFRSAVTFSSGTVPNTTYNYPSEITYKDYGYTTGIEFFYTKNLIENPKNRTYIGGEFFLQRANNEFHLSDVNIMSTEQKISYGIGPKIIYDLFIRDNYIISLHASFLLNLYNISISQDKVNGNGELQYKDEATYQGYSFTFHPGITLQKKIFDNFFITFGSKLSFNFPYHLSNKTEHNYSNLWSSTEEDVYDSPFTYAFNFHIGIQGQY